MGKWRAIASCVGRWLWSALFYSSGHDGHFGLERLSIVCSCWIIVNSGGIRSVGGGCVRRESINSIDLHQQHLSPLTSIEQNTRVLTLAEQIIAAIPDRIKVILAPFFLSLTRRADVNNIDWQPTRSGWLVTCQFSWKRFDQNETEEMVVGWSPCMELESSVVSEAQSVEGSIDLAIASADAPSIDANDLTFEFSDQQYRYILLPDGCCNLSWTFVSSTGTAKQRRPAQVCLQRRPAAFNLPVHFQSIHRRRRPRRPISVNSSRWRSNRRVFPLLAHASFFFFL